MSAASPPGRIAGSSPRLRGTVSKRGRNLYKVRFIPALAGNRHQPGRTGCLAAVHPRACGEQFFRRSTSTIAVGLSPRLRGTERRRCRVHGRGRFIPALAGNRARHRRRQPGNSVHPRACGEQFCAKATACCSVGSSPRLRGTVHLPPPYLSAFRFIPALAGNRSCRTVWTRSAAVHPRACGEQLARGRHVQRDAGSSPRLRGTAGESVCGAGRYRFIPALAGNSAYLLLQHRMKAVHPRACGEQSSTISGSGGCNGSSPRLRGTARPHCPHRRRRWFIPALAGNSLSIGITEQSSPVHPRACGEQVPRASRTMQGAGSSPRLRGTVALWVCELPLRRFIPALAGNRWNGHLQLQ